MWGGDGGLKGWRVEMGVANLATALGKRTQTVKATPTILTSWPSNNMVISIVITTCLALQLLLSLICCCLLLFTILEFAELVR